MPDNELTVAEQEQLNQLLLDILNLFKRYQATLPDLDKLRDIFPNLSALLKKSGDLGIQGDKTSQLEQTNQLLKAIVLNQELLTVIRQEIAEVTRLKELEKSALSNPKPDMKPVGPSLADQYEERLNELLQLEAEAQRQAEMLKEKLSVLSKKLKDAEDDLDQKYERAAEAEKQVDVSEKILSEAYEAVAEKEIKRDSLVEQRAENVAAFDQYLDANKERLTAQLKTDFTTKAIEEISESTKNSETTDLRADQIKAASPKINEACAANLIAKARLVAHGVDTQFFKESREDFSKRMEQVREEKGSVELDDSIDSVLQGAAGPLTLEQFNATRDGLETNIAAILDPEKLGTGSSEAAKQVADQYFSKGEQITLTKEVLAQASQHAVSAHDMVEANRQVNEAEAKKESAKGAHTEAVGKFKKTAEDVEKAAQVVAAFRQSVGEAQQALKVENPPKPSAETRDDAKHHDLVQKSKLLPNSPQAQQAAQQKLEKEARRKAEEAAQKAAEEKQRQEQEKKKKEEQAAEDRNKIKPSNKPGAS